MASEIGAGGAMPPSPVATKSSLFERLGGQSGLRSLLDHFYADVRQHGVIGPIFNARIHDWPAHMARITEFWARQTGGPSSYSGAFAAAHLPLGLQAEHFHHWLDLWDFNCRRRLPPAEAIELSERARQIAVNLRRIVAGRNGLETGESRGAPAGEP